MSIMYGSDALIGSINIILDENTKSFVSGALGSNRMKSLFLKNSYKRRRLKYTFNAFYHEDEGEDYPFSDITDSSYDYFRNEDFRTKDKLAFSQLAMFFSGSINDFYMKSFMTSNRAGIYYYTPSIGEELCSQGHNPLNSFRL